LVLVVCLACGFFCSLVSSNHEQTIEEVMNLRAPFVCSVNDLLGQEAKTFAKRPAAKLANKWEKSSSQVCGCVNARLSVAIDNSPVPLLLPQV
jgi:hypothetical protein